MDSRSLGALVRQVRATVGRTQRRTDGRGHHLCNDKDGVKTFNYSMLFAEMLLFMHVLGSHPPSVRGPSYAIQADQSTQLT